MLKMNKIKAVLDKSEYGYDDFLNYQIDDYWLDEKLEKEYPGMYYQGTVPTLSFGMEQIEEEKVVWKRILPSNGQSAICPILMCPDDNDFSCLIIVAEIINKGELILWNRLGADQTKEVDPNKIGSNVLWLDKMQTFIFKKEEYYLMLEMFKSKYALDKIEWQSKLQDQS